MKSKRILMLVALFLSALAVATAGEGMILRWGELNPAGHLMTRSAEEFGRLVKERTNGRINIEVYPAGQLGDARTMIEGVQMNAIAFFRCSSVYLGDYNVREADLFAMPFMFRDREHLWKVLNGEIGDLILESVNKAQVGFRGIGFFEEGARHFFFTKKNVKTIEDMKGLKIRVPETEIMMETVRAFAASPTPTAYSELFSALQTGVVDGAENPAVGYYANKFYEVAPIYTLDGHTYDPSVIIVSQMVWDKLSPADQGVLVACMKEAEKFNMTESEKADQEAFDKLRAAKVAINPVPDKTPWQKAVQPIYRKYAANYQSVIEKIQNTR